MAAAEPSAARCSFIVTGFGPFNGQPENPTQTLIHTLQQRKNEIAQCSRIVSCSVLNVSMEACDEFFQQQRHALVGSTSTPVVMLHFGVDGNASTLKLEQRAYNCANFRCMDERGQRPQDQPIDPSFSEDIEHFCCTSLPLDALASQLQAKGWGVEVSLSAGRFVCNYIFMRSLRLIDSIQQATAKGPGAEDTAGGTHSEGRGAGHVLPSTTTSSSLCMHSLFVHVPNSNIVGPDELFAFALDLMSCIATTLS